MAHGDAITATVSDRDAPGGAGAIDETASEPGVCNIGSAEIARRRRAGHVGLGTTAVLLAGLAAINAPPAARFAIALPAAVAASGYLPARFRFCVGVGSRGIYNCGEVGPTREVADETARAADRAKAIQLGLASAAIGSAVGIGAVLAAR